MMEGRELFWLVVKSAPAWTPATNELPRDTNFEKLAVPAEAGGPGSGAAGGVNVMTSCLQEPARKSAVSTAMDRNLLFFMVFDILDQFRNSSNVIEM